MPQTLGVPTITNLDGCAAIKHDPTLQAREERLGWGILGADAGRLFVTLAAIMAGGAGSTAAAVSSLGDTSPGKAMAGRDWKPCTDCPPFVRVPSPPTNLRPVQYVAKYELRWNDYLKAVDDGTCPVPKGQTSIRGISAEDIRANLPHLRLDWSVTILKPAEVDCYIRWLQDKTGHRIAMPSPQEWDWFARAGKATLRYPWGNEPSVDSEAVRGNATLPSKFYPYDFNDRRSGANFIVSGVAAGQFTPNAWGIHDLLGNNTELTNLVLSPSDFRSRTGNATLLDAPSVVLKGVDHIDAQWRDGIAQEHYTLILDGRYSARAAVRLILIARGA